MESVLGAAGGVVRAIWDVLCASAPYVLFGFAAAGVIRALLPDNLVARHLGGRSVSSVFKAALFGIPLPLCSCGVVPTAISLRKQGAGRGATSAFLVSTPETGVDSIALTYALLDPLMTVFRPIAAFFTASTVGLLENQFGRDEVAPVGASNGHESAAAPGESASCCSGAGKVESPAQPAGEESCCSVPKVHPVPPAPCCAATTAPRERILSGFAERLRESMGYAFGALLADVGPWLLLGIVVAGVITWLVPPGFLATYLGHGLLPMLVMLAAGIPLYICASASTPVAAALVAKGLSPGAALVFLLAGPATNAGTITVVARFMGKRSLGIYVVSIAVCSLCLGLVLDGIYLWAGLKLVPRLHSGHDHGVAWWPVVAGLVLVVLVIHSVWRRRPQVAAAPSSAMAVHAR